MLALALTFVDQVAYHIESRQQTSKVAHDREIGARSDHRPFLRPIQLENQRKFLLYALIELIDALKVILRSLCLGDFEIAVHTFTDKDREFALVCELVLADTGHYDSI